MAERYLKLGGVQSAKYQCQKDTYLNTDLHLSIYYNTWSHRRNVEDAMRGKCPSKIFLPKNGIFGPWVEGGK